MNWAGHILKLFGWTVEKSVPEVRKCVIVVAPHTSNWDLLIGKLGYAALGRHASFLMKKEWFFWPLNRLWHKMGGYPVDRQHHTSLIDQMVLAFHEQDYFNLAITPEGTRKANAQWKLGFYFIAQQAGVPIHLAYLDYGRKRVGVSRQIDVNDRTADDVLQEVKNFYKANMGRYPQQFKV